MRPTISQRLVEKAKGAMIAAIEVYNRPSFVFREETFSILALAAWEALLKAKIALDHKNDVRSIYVYATQIRKDGTKGKRRVVKRSRTGNPLTLELVGAANALGPALDQAAKGNLIGLTVIRDNAVHFLGDRKQLALRASGLALACVRNFVTAARLWFKADFSEDLTLLLPLGFLPSSEVVDVALLPGPTKNVVQALDRLVARRAADAGDDFTVSLRVDIAFRKVGPQPGSALPSAAPVAVRDEPGAIPVHISEDEIKRNWPWDYEELCSRLKVRYTDFKQDAKYHARRRALLPDKKYVYVRALNPSKPLSVTQALYSPNILNEFDKHYTRKP